MSSGKGFPKKLYLTIRDDGGPTHIALFEKCEDTKQEEYFHAALMQEKDKEIAKWKGEADLHLTQAMDYQKRFHAKDAEIARLREALEFYASYMDGDNPEFTKGGWQKYPDPKIAKQALSGDAGEKK